MENLQLILVTVLITLLSFAVIGIISYLVVVVRKLRQVVKDQTVDITNLQQALQNEVTDLHNRIGQSNDEFDNRLREYLREMTRQSLGLKK
jgi:predicted PurR-regulated permease PerM